MTRNVSLLRTSAVACMAILSMPAMAIVGGGQMCVPTPSATVDVPAPGSGSISIEPLSRFNAPAQICTQVGLTASGIDFDYSASLATRFNSARFPSVCAGVSYGLNGGPVYAYTAGKGAFALNLSNPTAITGSFQASSYSFVENLTLSVGDTSYRLDTDVQEFRATVTLNADQSVDVKICTPRGGVPVKVNGQSTQVPASIWQCLVAPAPAAGTARVTYQEGC